MIQLDGNQFPKMQRRVLTSLQAEIASNDLVPGNSLGNEVSLAKRMNVARNTIRFLFDKLERAHVIRRVPRHGAFLEEPFQVTNVPVPAKEKEVCYYRWCDSLQESEISSEIYMLAERLGIPLKLFDIHLDTPLYVHHLDHLSAQDKAIMIPPIIPEIQEAMERALNRGVEILLLDRYVEELNIPSVIFDHYTAAVIAVRHLLVTTGLPVWFYGYKSPTPARKRYEAWLACMLEFGYENPEQYTMLSDNDMKDDNTSPDYYRKKLFDFFRIANPLNAARKIAVFCMTESQAKDLYLAAQEFHFEIGRDVFVASIGSATMLEHLNPPCTYVLMDYSELVRNAENFLMSKGMLPKFCRMVPTQKLRVLPSAPMGTLPLE